MKFNRVWISLVMLATIVLTIFAGIYFLDDRRFFVISLLILMQIFIPFAFLYESRKPPARELVMIAVLVAIAVAGRAAFFMLPQFKPVVAVVIISGVALGGEIGFMVGAMTILVSNIFFGQGPWTPWQMLAMGLIGLLAGALFHHRNKSISRVVLAIFGALVTVVVYGGIMNSAGVLMFQPQPTRDMFLFSFMYGLPFDIVHGVATAVFILLMARPILEKIDRIQTKYGDFRRNS
ncbi:MAG: ECF transporter S component [Defluviitaleaceae bacterium]|nr:ECF transporter S component [Defluviitaleaceae bacterium]